MLKFKNSAKLLILCLFTFPHYHAIGGGEDSDDEVTQNPENVITQYIQSNGAPSSSDISRDGPQSESAASELKKLERIFLELIKAGLKDPVARLTNHFDGEIPNFEKIEFKDMKGVMYGEAAALTDNTTANLKAKASLFYKKQLKDCGHRHADLILKFINLILSTEDCVNFHFWDSLDTCPGTYVELRSRAEIIQSIKKDTKNVYKQRKYVTHNEKQIEKKVRWNADLNKNNKLSTDVIEKLKTMQSELEKTIAYLKREIMTDYATLKQTARIADAWQGKEFIPPGFYPVVNIFYRNAAEALYCLIHELGHVVSKTLHITASCEEYKDRDYREDVSHFFEFLHLRSLLESKSDDILPAKPRLLYGLIDLALNVFGTEEFLKIKEFSPSEILVIKWLLREEISFSEAQKNTTVEDDEQYEEVIIEKTTFRLGRYHTGFLNAIWFINQLDHQEIEMNNILDVCTRPSEPITLEKLQMAAEFLKDCFEKYNKAVADKVPEVEESPVAEI